MEGFFAEFIKACATLLIIGLVMWMLFVVIMLFKELFTPGDIQIRTYLYRAWRLIIIAFEITFYGGTVVAAYLLVNGEKYTGLYFGSMLVIAIVISILLLKYRLHRIRAKRYARRQQQDEGNGHN